MNRKFHLFMAVLVVSLGVSFYAFAQDETDALRYSYLSPQGTARAIGLGGAVGSIGGDFTSLSVNPAGIGVYRSSEFMFTPSLKINSTSSNYVGNTLGDDGVRFNFSNIGAVFTKAAKGRRYENSAWKTFSFGIGLNRVADFTRSYTYSGVNNTSSGSEVFVVDAINQNSEYPGFRQDLSTLGGIGYQSYLVNEDSIGFFTIVPFETGVNQRRTVKEWGGISDIVLSFGGNFREKLMLGATLGLPSLRYLRDITYEERDATDNPNNNFNSYVYREALTTTGLGINLKLGFIYKPNDAFRIGGAIHTPTAFGLNDIQSRFISSNTEQFAGITTIQSGTVDGIPDNVFSYTVKTPWRGVVSAAGFIGKYGFITADYEYVDYASARFNYNREFAAEESIANQLIRQKYRGASNVRVGAEGRFDKVMVRLGFGYYGSPYKQSFDDASRIDISAGIGYRFSNWFADLGFVNSRYNLQEQPYELKYPQDYLQGNPTGEIAVPKATIRNNLNNVAFTLGWKF